ncbi:unnamed protein product [Chilo suppressalis]|uniref:Uncharacterized protein n=1 Tax=Chilo suppressalis TaxID=168631 RepID=A0ABN8B2S9_CHISP|nr:unnamed protein product [Chilo suppressalis]
MGQLAHSKHNAASMRRLHWLHTYTPLRIHRALNANQISQQRNGRNIIAVDGSLVGRGSPPSGWLRLVAGWRVEWGRSGGWRDGRDSLLSSPFRIDCAEVAARAYASVVRSEVGKEPRDVVWRPTHRLTALSRAPAAPPMGVPSAARRDAWAATPRVTYSRLTA